MTRHTFNIEIPKDENGFVGRECLECKKYFKLKPGTGLPTKHCHCPYCDYEGDQNTFFTPDQLEYANSVGRKMAYEKVINPLLDDFSKSLKKLERSTKGGFLQVKVSHKRQRPYFPIKTYDELELETNITCDNCGLDFAIYGVFSQCPDCNELNAFSIFQKSLDVSRKQFELFEKFENDKEVEQTNLKFIVSNVISSFDALGKEIRRNYPQKFPVKPRNLFQNLNELEKVFAKSYSVKLEEQIEDFEFIQLMFQVRHIHEHNMGVVDDDFVRKTSGYKGQIGRKYLLVAKEVETFLSGMNKFVKAIEGIIKND